jgi:folate-binding protein YgfZ
MLVAEAGAIEALASHLENYRIGRKVEVRDRAGERSFISVIGPATRAFLDAPPAGREDRHLETMLGGVGCRVLGTPNGVDLIYLTDDAEPLRTALAEKGLTEVPEAAAEILRVESGRPRFGLELDRSVMPAEGGIVERAVDFEKGCYLGQEPVARLHYKGRPNRLLRGLKLSRPAQLGEVINGSGRELGTITTACVSPAVGPIALALVRREAEPGATVAVGDDGASAEVVELPLRTR